MRSGSSLVDDDVRRQHCERREQAGEPGQVKVCAGEKRNESQ